VLACGDLSAAEEPPESSPAAGEKGSPAPPEPLRFESSHRLASGSTRLEYTVTAEEIFLKDGEDKPAASFFTISYTLKGGDGSRIDR
jgi:hypothetical protein